MHACAEQLVSCWSTMAGSDGLHLQATVKPNLSKCPPTVSGQIPVPMANSAVGSKPAMVRFAVPSNIQVRSDPGITHDEKAATIHRLPGFAVCGKLSVVESRPGRIWYRCPASSW